MRQVTGQAGKRATRKTPPLTRGARWWRRAKIFFCYGVILMGVVFIGASFYAYQKLMEAAAIVPRLDEVMRELNSRPSVVVSSDGKTLYSIQVEYRKAVRREEIPNRVVNAMLAAEDKRFLQHGGVDPIALARAAFVAAREGEATQGGSTLTMQIAKRVFSGSEQTIDRKLRDMALAVKIEQELSKDQILALYLNQVYFGQRAYGIAAAADVYFGKTLEELTTAEAAMLARCVRRPSQENPIANLDRAIANRNVVLGIMLEEGMIDRAEYEAAKSEEVRLRERRPDVISARKEAPYFVDFVLEELERKGIDISRGGYRVITTVNSEHQKMVDEGISKWVRNFRRARVNQAAMLVTDKSGRILAMTGGPDYRQSQFNMIWMSPGRQPGSSFKPFVYAAGLERGAFTSRSGISTTPMKKPGTDEYFEGGANRGRISIAQALAWSNNTAAVRAMDEVGTRNVVNFCRRQLGMQRSNLPAVLSLALGSGEVYMTELASAYSVFQNGGTRMPVYAIERIVFPDGNERSYSPGPVRNAISAETAEYIDLSLRQTVTSGTGRAASGVFNARGKTGTTSDHKDVWFAGYTDELMGIVWMANEQRVNGRPVAAPLRGLYGGEGPARVWGDIMRDIQREIGEKSRRFGDLPTVSREEAPEEDAPPEEVEPPVVPEETAPAEAAPVEPPLIVDPAVDPPSSTGQGSSAGSSGGAPGGGGGAASGSGVGGGGGSGGAVGVGGTGGGRDIVYVSVCADSGSRATAFCPEVVSRPFFKGTEPGGRCSVHGRGASIVAAGRVVRRSPAAWERVVFWRESEVWRLGLSVSSVVSGCRDCAGCRGPAKSSEF